MTTLLKRLWRETVWAQDILTPGEERYRQLKRVWLPIYDSIAGAMGVLAALVGSRLLYDLFPTELIDFLGVSLTAIALACLAGVVFPKLWLPEMGGKILLVAALSGYAGLVAVTSFPNNLFVASVIILSLPLPLFRLYLLGEELKERRADRGPQSNAAPQ